MAAEKVLEAVKQKMFVLPKPETIRNRISELASKVASTVIVNSESVESYFENATTRARLKSKARSRELDLFISNVVKYN